MSLLKKLALLYIGRYGTVYRQIWNCYKVDMMSITYFHGHTF